MKRCANSHKGCPELARGGAVHYCTDCYHAWQEGGCGAVQAAIDLKRKPAPQHVCVGQEQLAAKDARIAELEAERRAVFDAVIPPFAGQPRPFNLQQMLDAIQAGNYTLNKLRKVWYGNADLTGVPKAGTAVRVQRARMMVDWYLTQVQDKTAYRKACATLEYKLADVMGKCCHAHQCQPSTTPHPSAKQVVQPEQADRKQLDRIESLAKQAASPNAIGPFSYGLLLGAVLLGLTHFFW